MEEGRSNEKSCIKEARRNNSIQTFWMMKCLKFRNGLGNFPQVRYREGGGELVDKNPVYRSSYLNLQHDDMSKIVQLP